MKSGTIAEIIGKVIKVGNVKIEIQVEIYTEEMYSEKRQKVVNALYLQQLTIPINQSL